MVIGEFNAKFGEKNRISIPKKFRQELGSDFILTRGYEKSLLLVNNEMWKKVAEDIINGSFINKNIRETSRFLVGGAFETTADKSGRIIIPKNLIEYSEIVKDVVIIGLVNWIEIWSKENWLKKLDYLSSNGEEIADQLNQATRIFTKQDDERK